MIKRSIKNALRYLALLIAITIFVLASLHFIKTDIARYIALIFSAGYILLFLWVNEME